MHWSAWLEGLTIRHSDQGETILSGEIRDQAAFYGLLVKLRDLALILLLVKYRADESLMENGDSDDPA
jgi:hypothetical protein